MNKGNKNKLVPKLRFPEFEKEGEWKEKSFDKLFQIGNGKDYKHLKAGDIPVYGSGGYMLSVDSYLYEGESVCIGRKGTIDKPIFLTGKFWTVDTLFFTHSFKDCIPKFIYILFQKTNWLKHNEAGGIPSLSKTTIEKIKAFIPKVDEQKKIANCISSLDDLISAENHKLDSFREHKKGLMQLLFPSENENLPKLRFPEFEKEGEWKEKFFDQLFQIGSGKDYKHLQTGDIPVYGSGGYMLSVDSYLYEGESVCIGRKGTIDKPIFLTGKFWTVDTLFFTHSFKDCIPKFIYILFQKTNWLKHNEAGGIPSLSKTTIEKIKAFIPRVDEQKKIANCISSLDDLIIAQSQKIEALKIHKKGLMQQLFPNIKETEAA